MNIDLWFSFIIETYHKKNRQFVNNSKLFAWFYWNFNCFYLERGRKNRVFILNLCGFICIKPWKNEKKYKFNKYEWVVELLSWRCLAAGGHLRSSSCCWCQLVLRILKVYRIDSTQDTFSIRLRSDMLSSLQWKLPEEYIDLYRTKKTSLEYGNWNSRFRSTNPLALFISLSICLFLLLLPSILAAWWLLISLHTNCDLIFFFILRSLKACE